MKPEIQRALIAVAVAALVPLAAWAQSAPSTTAPKAAKPPASTTPTAPKPAASTSLTGVWTGQVTESGRPKPFAITITVDSKGAAATDYPEQGCAGKLTKIGTSGAFTFYSEKITKGAYDSAKGTGCLDGTVVVTKPGSNLLFSWFGSVDNQPIQASATLTLSKPKI